MLPHWKHLTLEQRVEIAHGLAHDEPLGSIAERIGVDPTSVSKEIKAYCRGEYGRTPAPIDPEIQKQILGDEKPLTVRYADTLEPVVDKTREKLGDLARSDEDVLSYIAFPNLAEKFFEERKAKEENVATYSIVEC